MRAFAAIIIGIILLIQPSTARYAAPYGAGVACTSDDPCALATAQAQGGDVWLLPGTYTGDLTVTASLRSVPGTRARIDGGVNVTTVGITLRDLEITDTSWLTRTNATSAQTARSVNVAAQNVTLDNLWIHDLANGIAAFNGAGGASAGLIVKNSLIYNIGFGAGLGTGHGHSIYTQNDAIGTKLFQHTTLANQYGFSIQAYGSSGVSAQLERMTFDGNVSLNNRLLIGGGRPLKQITIKNNRLFNSHLQIGYSNHNNEDVSVSGNWIGNGRIQAQWILTPTVQHNAIVPLPNDNAVYLVPPYGGGVWNTNTYYKPGGSSSFGIDGLGFYNLASWQTTTGWDSTSTVTSGVPLSNWTDITALAPHRGRAVVYNWTNAPTITLDLAPLGLTTGSAYRLINAQNVAQSQVFIAGAPVSVPMSGWTVAVPYGASAPLATFDSRFAVFLVEPL